MTSNPELAFSDIESDNEDSKEHVEKRDEEDGDISSRIHELLKDEKVNEKNAHREEVGWYYDISKWQQYRLFMGSENFIQKPSKGLTSAHKHVKLPYREGELDDD